MVAQQLHLFAYPDFYVFIAIIVFIVCFQLRGKAISLHSQAITEWCLQYGAYNLRLKLVSSYYEAINVSVCPCAFVPVCMSVCVSVSL